MNNLTVIVITHNRMEYTKRTLESLYKTVPNAFIIIFDNASTDGTEPYLRTMAVTNGSPQIIMSNKNLGWGAAVNETLDLYKGKLTEYILLSNNDCIYGDGWFEKSVELYQKYPKIGVLGLWSHTSHGTRQDLGDMLIKDDMPAVAWLTKKSVLADVGKISEHGPCATKGGNGEDTNYTGRVMEKGYWVCGTKPDTAQHIDGY